MGSKRYAQLQVERIQQKTGLLKTQTGLGKLVESNYRIIYRLVNAKEIHILMVHHGASNLHLRIQKPKK